MRVCKKASQEIRRIVARIVEEYRPQEVILFGSYAYGEPRADSDLDLLIVRDTEEIPFMRRVTVSRICDALHLRIPFQPFVVTPEELRRRLELGDSFFEEICERGKTLYRARPAEVLPGRGRTRGRPDG